MKTTLIFSTALFLGTSTLAQEQAELTASDAGSRDTFGQSVAISGSTVVVGSTFDDVTALNQGSAYVYVSGSPGWSQQAKLIAGDARANDRFGTAVAVSGNTSAIGAHGDDHVDGSNADEGSAYAFVRTGTIWSQQAKLTAGDAAAGDLFGLTIAIAGDTIVVGAPYDDDLGANSGSSYVFVRSGTVWSQQAKLTASDGVAGDLFGSSVSVYGDTAVIGAPRDDDGASNSGSAYVFVRSGTTWSQQGKLNAGDPAANDAFGRSTSLFGDELAVGAYQKDEEGIDSGAAYVFTRGGTVWSQQAKLVASDASTFDNFGRSVALGAGTLVIGACQDAVVGKSSGSAYVFEGSGSSWTQASKVRPTEAAAGDFFGTSAGLSGSVAVIGAPLDDDAGLGSGSAHVFPVGTEGTRFCFPSVDAVACPCSNPPVGSKGCDNFGAHSGGASLSGAGLASLAADSLLLTATGENNTSLTVFWQGKTNITPGVAHGAGVRCVSGTLKRLYSGNASGGTISRPTGANPDVHTRSAAVGDPISAGELRYYFTIYRDPGAAGPCGNPANTINLSNAVEVQWAP